MARLRILHFPDPRLRRHAEPVGTVDDRIRRLIDDMFETMYDAPGIGLAAPQVDVSKRVVTIDLSKDRSGQLCLVDPEIQWAGGEMEIDEGCLSVPDVFEAVRRAERIRVAAADRDGDPARSRPRACSPPASSTRSTTSTAGSSWTTSPGSSGNASEEGGKALRQA